MNANEFLGSLFGLSGKVAVVTGGNSGLGLGFARGIAKQGGDVAIWARSADKNAAAKAELETYGGRVLSRQVDVASEDEVKAAAHEVTDSNEDDGFAKAVERFVLPRATQQGS